MRTSLSLKSRALPKHKQKTGQLCSPLLHCADTLVNLHWLVPRATEVLLPLVCTVCMPNRADLKHASAKPLPRYHMQKFFCMVVPYLCLQSWDKNDCGWSAFIFKYHIQPAPMKEPNVTCACATEAQTCYQRNKILVCSERQSHKHSCIQAGMTNSRVRIYARSGNRRTPKVSAMW